MKTIKCKICNGSGEELILTEPDNFHVFVKCRNCDGKGMIKIRSLAEIINEIEKIREKNNDEWIKFEKLDDDYTYEAWEIVRRVRTGKNKEKMNMLKRIFKKYPEKARQVFVKITENDRLINELSKELCE